MASFNTKTKLVTYSGSELLELITWQLGLMKKYGGFGVLDDSYYTFDPVIDMEKQEIHVWVRGVNNTRFKPEFLKFPIDHISPD